MDELAADADILDEAGALALSAHTLRRTLAPPTCSALASTSSSSPKSSAMLRANRSNLVTVNTDPSQTAVTEAGHT
jgi:hypothetical protein